MNLKTTFPNPSLYAFVYLVGLWQALLLAAAKAPSGLEFTFLDIRKKGLTEESVCLISLPGLFVFVCLGSLGLGCSLLLTASRFKVPETPTLPWLGYLLLLWTLRLSRNARTESEYNFFRILVT